MHFVSRMTYAKHTISKVKIMAVFRSHYWQTAANPISKFWFIVSHCPISPHCPENALQPLGKLQGILWMPSEQPPVVPIQQGIWKTGEWCIDTIKSIPRFQLQTFNPKKKNYQQVLFLEEGKVYICTSVVQKEQHVVFHFRVIIKLH